MFLKIVEVAGIPLLSGSFFCKYVVNAGGKAICKGRTCSYPLTAVKCR